MIEHRVWLGQLTLRRKCKRIQQHSSHFPSHGWLAKTIVRISSAAKPIGSRAGGAQRRNRSRRSRNVSSSSGRRGKYRLRFVDLALEASKNVSENHFAFGRFVFSSGIGLQRISRLDQSIPARPEGASSRRSGGGSYSAIWRNGSFAAPRLGALSLQTSVCDLADAFVGG